VSTSLLGVRHTVWTSPFVGYQRPPLFDARHILFRWTPPYLGYQCRFYLVDITFFRVSTSPLLGQAYRLDTAFCRVSTPAFTWCQTYLVSLDTALLGVPTSPYLMSEIPFGCRLFSGVNARLYLMPDISCLDIAFCRVSTSPLLGQTYLV
jgi:hypothetical protein